MNILKPVTMIAAAIAITSCGGTEDAAPAPAETLEAQLSSVVEQGRIMYGHQDDLLYGHSWKLADDADGFTRSDVKDVCGSYPAVFGMDLGGIEFLNEQNIDNNRFDQMRDAAVAHYERGGIITLSWHPRNPLTGGDAWDVTSDEVVASILPGGKKHRYFKKWLRNVADYIGSFRTADGKPVPVIWRPWHEHTGSWFWWGQDLCTTEQYKALWEMTYGYMEEKRGLDNLVWAYSPGAGGLTPELFAERYPGDGIVDMVGFDCYQYGSDEQYMADMKAALEVASAFGTEHGKLVAVTETGYEGIPGDDWWTSVLYPAVKDYPVAYVLTWRNACDRPGHFYAPFPGQESAEDFKAFAALPQMMFL